MARKPGPIEYSEIETLLSSRQVSDFLGVDIKTVQLWASEGRLPAWRLGNQYLRFRPADVQAMLKPIR